MAPTLHVDVVVVLHLCCWRDCHDLHLFSGSLGGRRCAGFLNVRRARGAAYGLHDRIRGALLLLLLLPRAAHAAGHQQQAECQGRGAAAARHGQART
jgi:hypothetical protein